MYIHYLITYRCILIWLLIFLCNSRNGKESDAEGCVQITVHTEEREKYEISAKSCEVYIFDTPYTYLCNKYCDKTVSI